MKRIGYYMTALALMLVLSACDEDWFDSLTGRWELISVVEHGHEYTTQDYDVYVFDHDGRGYYEDQNGYRYEFWWTDNGYGNNRSVRIEYYDGLEDMFYYDFDRGDLLLSYDRSFRSYRVYRSRGHYY